MAMYTVSMIERIAGVLRHGMMLVAATCCVFSQQRKLSTLSCGPPEKRCRATHPLSAARTARTRSMNWWGGALYGGEGKVARMDGPTRAAVAQRVVRLPLLSPSLSHSQCFSFFSFFDFLSFLSFLDFFSFLLFFSFFSLRCFLLGFSEPASLSSKSDASLSPSSSLSRS
jgi:hypothetical protein